MLMVATFLLRALNVCKILLTVRLESTTEFIGRGLMKTRTFWDEFDGLASIVKRILLGLHNLRKPLATIRIFLKRKLVELS